jgi:hypothetical protein
MPDSAPSPDRPIGSGTAAIHVAALWALAVAGPLYGVLSESAEFFVAYRTTRVDIALFVIAVSVVAPLAVWALVRLAGTVSARAGRAGLSIVVAALAGLLAAQALQSLRPPTYLHIGMAAGFGTLAGVLYGMPAARAFVTWLAPAILAFPLVFLLHRNISAIVWPAHEDASVEIPPDLNTPIVFIVFDQLPLTSILAPDGGIDAGSYPGFAELARVSTWFRNATTVGELTTWALPPLVSGEFADAGRLPSVAGYPRNLFTALGRTYAMEVFEPITTLCPDEICRPGARRGGPSLGPMLSDAVVVMLHRIVPPAWSSRLPPVTENWRGFADAQGFQRRWAGARERDRRDILDDFVDAISRADPARTVYFLHALLPHEPYEYLPSGQDSGRIRRLPGISFGRWTTNELPVAQGYARHLLQVALVDRFVGRLLDRLRTEGLFDRALLVVTSDHGVSFVPGRAMKALSEDTATSIAPVPLFVKRPFQPAGEWSDRNVQSVDVLPAIADVLDLDLPYEMDGQSPFDAGRPAPQEKIVVHAGGRARMTFAADELRDTTAVIERRRKWFGDGPAPYWTTRLDPLPELRGRSIDRLPVATDPDLRIAFDAADDVMHAEPQGDLVPALLTGRVRGTVGRSASVDLAIAINGRIEATTSTHVDLGDTPDGTWSALVEPTVYKAGYNDVRVYVIRRDPGGVRLIEGFRTDPPQGR